MVRLGNLVGWLPVIVDDQPYDWSYLVRILRHKLAQMERAFRQEGITTDSPQRAADSVGGVERGSICSTHIIGRAARAGTGRDKMKKSFYCSCGFATTLEICMVDAEAKIEQLFQIMHPMYGSDGHEPCDAATARRARGEAEKDGMGEGEQDGTD